MKLYKVIFNEYIDRNKTTVTDKKGFYIHDIDNLIITEDDIEGFNCYGKGIKERIYVGKLFKG